MLVLCVFVTTRINSVQSYNSLVFTVSISLNYTQKFALIILKENDLRSILPLFFRKVSTSKTFAKSLANSQTSNHMNKWFHCFFLVLLLLS